MELSFDVIMDWNTFWTCQQNNPNCEMAFMYNSKTYILAYECYKSSYWGIYEFNPDGNSGTLGECLVKNYDRVQKRKGKYPTDDEWQSMLDSCFAVVTAPVLDGKSFKDVIDDIRFE